MMMAKTPKPSIPNILTDKYTWTNPPRVCVPKIAPIQNIWRVTRRSEIENIWRISERLNILATNLFESFYTFGQSYVGLPAYHGQGFRTVG